MSDRKSKQTRRSAGISTRAKRDQRAFTRDLIAEVLKFEAQRETAARLSRSRRQRRNALIALLGLVAAGAALLSAVL